MAEIATIARPYAEALFQVAQKGDLAGVAAQLGELAQVAEQPQLRQFADNPKISAAQVFDVLSSVVKTPLGEVAKNFLRTLIDNGRLSALPEIAAQFIQLKNAQSGVADALIESAFPVEGAALSDLVATLEKRFARKLNASVKLVPELIGGVRVVVGDEVLDTSVKARLEQMKAALTA
jgi:F-type H+-transporting ATPase subunit delta